MTEYSITELRGTESCEDLWIIGSGKSMDHVDPCFFIGKRTLVINRATQRFPTTYAMQTDNPLLEHPAAATLVLPVCSSGIYSHGPMICDRDCYRYEHDDNREVVDDQALAVLGSDRLVMGCSAMHVSMHFAAYLGAANIILCGHDGGTLGGRLQYDGYYRRDETAIVWDQQLIHQMMRYTRKLREALTAHYGCRILSLSPFAGLTTDGYQFAEC